MYFVRRSKRRGFSGNAQLTVERTIARPRGRAGIRIWRLVGQISLLASLSGHFLMTCVQLLKCVWTLFCFSSGVEQNSPVWEARRGRLCLPNGANDCCAGCDSSPLFSPSPSLLPRLPSFPIPETSSPLCHLLKLVKSFPTGRCHLLQAAAVLALLGLGEGPSLPPPPSPRVPP